MADQIVVSVQGRILSLRLDRPEKKNALTRGMYLGMIEAIQQAEATAVRVVLSPEPRTVSPPETTWWISPTPSRERQVLRSVSADIRRSAKTGDRRRGGSDGGDRHNHAVALRSGICGLGRALPVSFRQPRALSGSGFQHTAAGNDGPPSRGRSAVLWEPFSAEAAHGLGIVNAVVPGNGVLATDSKAQQFAKNRHQLPATKMLLKRSNRGRSLIPWRGRRSNSPRCCKGRRPRKQ